MSPSAGTVNRAGTLHHSVTRAEQGLTDLHDIIHDPVIEYG